MNFHQTKGREADVVLHVFLENDYFGDETEPFPESSRLMNVVHDIACLWSNRGTGGDW